MAQVLVTGASGYIALHVCAQAVEAGHRVRGTVRSKSNAVKCDPIVAAAPGIELVEADLLDDAGWAAAVKDCACVFHVASPFPIQVRPPSLRHARWRASARDRVRAYRCCSFALSLLLSLSLSLSLFSSLALSSLARS